MNLMHSRLLASALVGALSIASVAGASRPKIVELYTSEGCSSCPPAELLLGELAVRFDVVPLAFHVDYWDDLGWRDRFALPEAARRQRWWSSTLGLPDIYTPQMIVEGRRSVVGSNRSAVYAALAEPVTDIPVAAALAAGHVSVSVSAFRGGGSYDVYAISYLPRAATAVARGENAGRTLTEWNIVRSWHKLGTADGRAVQFTINATKFPADASRLVILLQERKRGMVVGATVVNLQDSG